MKANMIAGSCGKGEKVPSEQIRVHAEDGRDSASGQTKAKIVEQHRRRPEETRGDQR